MFFLGDETAWTSSQCRLEFNPTQKCNFSINFICLVSISISTMNKSHSSQFLNTRNRTLQADDAMSTKSKNTVKTRVITNNIKGRPIDKITEEQLKPENKPFKSIYEQDYTPKGTARLYASQEIPKSSTQEVHLVNPPSARPEQTGSLQRTDDKFRYEIIKTSIELLANPITILTSLSFTLLMANQSPFLKKEASVTEPSLKSPIYKVMRPNTMPI